MNETQTSLPPPIAREMKPSVAAILRDTLIAGLFILVPIAITFWVAWWSIAVLTDWSVDFYETYCGATIGAALEVLLRILTLVILIFVTLLVGQLAKITLGKRLIIFAQNMLLKLPILRIVYSTCEQIGETVKTSQGGLFQAVAMFEYPRKGCYAIGFVTNDNHVRSEITENFEDEVYSIFMPTTPNPTSGFLMYIPKKDCKILSMSVSEAMSLIVSGGVILPGRKNTVMENKK